MESVVKPRKSNFSRASLSSPFISYWVTISSLFVLYKGTISRSGCGDITTPAACTDALRDMPSSFNATFSTSRTRGSRLASDSKPGSCANASFSLMFNVGGTSLVSLSTSAKVMSSTRPTSFNAALELSVPNVMICATCSRPYFSVTY